MSSLLQIFAADLARLPDETPMRLAADAAERSLLPRLRFYHRTVPRRLRFDLHP